VPLPPRLFCDTSFFYACLDPDDANHERAADLNVPLGLSRGYDFP
jgi:predicted nucleic acid-binding protein